jgi:putative ABC transport system permease protein
VAPPANTPLLNPQAGLIDGRWLRTEDTNAIVVNVDLLANEPDIKVGDDVTLEINGRNTVWNVVGTFRRVTTNRLPTAYVNSPYFSRLARLIGKGTSLQLVTAQSSEEYTAQVVKDIEEHFRKSGIEVNSIWVTQSIRARIEYTFNVLASVLFLLAVLCGLVGALGLMGTMTLNVLERTREIGIMRAIGASSRAIRQIIIVEGWFIGILSWILGAILSVPMSKYLSNALGIGTMRTPLTYGLSFSGVWLWLVIVLLLTTLASLLPAWNAARLTVRDVLSYE